MNTFTIDGTEFGIDLSASTLEIDQTDPKRTVVSLEIRGDDQLFTALTDNEESEWSWALYPPHLYIRGLETRDAKAVLEGGEDIEAALYMMQHNFIFNLNVTLTSNQGIEVSGLVDLMGKKKSFHAKFEKGGT